MIRFTLILLVAFSAYLAQAQKDTSSKDIYNVNYKWEAPVAVAFLGGSYFGFRILDKHASYTAEDVAKLNIQSINSFDRPIASLNPTGFEQAQKRSDLFLNISIASPALLLLDKKVRHHWAEFATLLAMTHAVDNAIYFGAVISVRKARPLTYNPALPLDQKIGEAKSNSFFSGHVSFSATSTFFAAKFYTDCHNIKGIKRILIYTGAAIPPAFVGYYRMRAGKHFKSDVITGLIVGAASGIGIQALHKLSQKDKNLSFQPYYNQGYNGITMVYNIR
ncbi:MAG: phosphatase PAP2 family protein [Chitinophagaceae bacterium]|jgi:membrane-associated phospholipid phosphatase